ncbi:hypothetical protein KC343_g7291 [Hortaea werneckii]|uniref:Uncharacterized protein n=1 Tax=Hortaea werneckii TaxID=91943 RepID=A0A3M7CVW3_HORWE|nr:hypothetical protein KC352_g14727 [Hortaea werneckii]KAI7563837.1 hypothetical protein KC317_g7459 [Hortaea werneckii]KAI7613882.1 hypothetical protein KC346_g7173 [Hortaea werneckii]KAI7623433.1 hypothetical protein KC343_g7291 [Hortaea werneckii]KAI7665681.1 hypothetical protein KC319_g7151 [Hortaea werneckii]
MSEANGDRFMVYNTCGITSGEINTRLSEDTQGSVHEDQYQIRDFNGTAQTVCQFHRENVQPRCEPEFKDLFVIFDRKEAVQQGVLVVNLAPKYGYPDAVRELPGNAIETIASLSIGHTYWLEQQETDEERKTELVPQNWFALYNLISDKAEFTKAKIMMNRGVQYIGAEEDEDEDKGDDDEENDQNDDGNEGESHEDSPVLPREFYRGVKPDTIVLDEIVSHHREIASRDNLSAEFFAAIDERYETDGALIARAPPGQDSFRCKGPAAGEILGWIYLGFMTWDEAKDFAGRQQ